MTVKVKIDGFKMQGVDIVANATNNTIMLNDEVVKFDVNYFISEIQDIVKSWKPKMINYAVLDGAWYSVEINDGINERVFKGKNRYPRNYDRFKKLIEQVKNAK